jgi:hypothetical protein
MSSIERNAQAFVSNARAQWKELVAVARATSPKNRQQAAAALSQAAGVGKSTLLRKLEAIHAAQQSGTTDERLIELGQARVLATFVKAKREARDDAQVSLRWMVAPELRDGAVEQFYRIGKLLGMTTSNEVWTFMLSQMVQWSDEEILHSAGEGHRVAKRSNP